ncbi:OmpA family protein [Methylosinus sp. Sm6]|uniref:OmpA family protein n=1 Tax=Methylosinus sp. Sm6 TaxID=2866948 RepID=UPI001C98E872|nr:OmpA family protein [Methylosinus sp. Sm6]MBY6242175.1 OmpA family protein [Methylosinus sp. Sm6]
MIDLIVHYGVFAATAFLLGALVAFGSRPRTADATGFLRRGDHTIALSALLAVAVAQVTLGRMSLYFDGALLLVAAFATGFGATAAVWGPIARDRLAWRIGAAALALTCAVANMEAARNLEAALRHKLGSLLARAGDDALNFEVSGRDVFLPGETPGGGAAAARLRQAVGVRSVWTVDALSPPAAALRDRALAAEAARAAEAKAALAKWETEWEKKRRAALAASSSGAAPLERRSAADSHAGTKAGARPAAPPGPIVWNPPLDPTLPPVARKEPPPAEPPSCKAALATLAAAQPIRFAAASAALRADSQQALVRLAELLKQCPQAVLEIRGYADSLGKAAKNRRLSLRRARTVADYLGRVGVGRERLVGAIVDEKRTTDGGTPRAETRVEIEVR